MASVITALQPVLYSAAQEVSAEPFGAIDSINASFDDKGVAKGDKVKVPYVLVGANETFSSANVPPEGTSNTAPAPIEVEITKAQKQSIVLNGEQIRSLENGSNYQEWSRQWAAQAMRALRNEAEADCALAIKTGASRAYGTPGTTPFASSLADLVGVRKILRDNGAPMVDLQLVVDTAAEGNLLNLSVIQAAYAAGSDAERRQGKSQRQYGFRIGQSAGIAAHVAGTGASFVIDAGSNLAAGSTILTTSTAGSGTILAGDVLSLQSDAGNKYVVNASSVVAGQAKPFTIGRPGLRVATVAAKTITVGAGYTPNLAFERSAVVGIMRPPIMPANPTMKMSLVSDSKGMTYLFIEIAQYGQITWEMHLAWGFKVVQNEHVALLMG
jgi:hypothetical protein